MYKYFFKRLFDFLISLILAISLTPIILLFALLVWLEDFGPAFYCAKRIGKKGRLFPMLKLRTMKVNAPDIRLEDGSTYNSKDDPRVTKIGKFLRKTSIDELPQIYNILVGQMAFIGPRPDTPAYLDKYTEEERQILTVRPGLTGYNQAINRNSVLTKEKLKNDIYYVKHISFFFDIKIIFMTIKTVLRHKDVYRKPDVQNSESKTLMILGGSILQLPAIRRAKELGHTVVVCDYNPEAIGFKEEGVIKEVVSTIDEQAVLEAAKRHKIDGIMTIASDRPMRVVASVAEKLNLNAVSVDTAIKATDKGVMRECLKSNGVPVPKFVKVNSLKEFLNVINQFNGKFIVKPTDNSGSRGVVLVDKNSSDYEKAFLYAAQNSLSGEVLIEEYMQGKEVSVETLSINGKCHIIQITDKITTGAPHFVEMGHIQPSGLSKKIKRRIEQVAIAANAAVGIKDGPSHTEIIVTDEGPKVVEIGARLGGDCITSHLVPFSTGVDMVECCIKIALGETPDVTKKFNKGSAILYLNQEKGLLKSVEGINDALKVKGIKEVEIVKKHDETITEIDSSAARIGFVIAQRRSGKDAFKACRKAIKKIKVNIKK